MSLSVSSKTLKSCICVSEYTRGLCRQAPACPTGNQWGVKECTSILCGVGGVPTGDHTALAPQFPAQLPAAAHLCACVLLSHNLPCLLLLFIYSWSSRDRINKSWASPSSSTGRGTACSGGCLAPHGWDGSCLFIFAGTELACKRDNCSLLSGVAAGWALHARRRRRRKVKSKWVSLTRDKTVPSRMFL